jgi:hypothetical protein
MAEIEVRFEGMKELQERLERMVKKYPDVTIGTMKKTGLELKKMAKADTDMSGVKKHSGNLMKGYRFSMPNSGANSYGMDIIGEFRAETKKNPHMHLIEHGHNVVPRGPTKKTKEASRETSTIKETPHGTTRVPGYHMIETTLNQFEKQYPEIALRCMEKIVGKL